MGCLIRLETHLVQTANCPSEQFLSHSGQIRGPTAFNRMVHEGRKLCRWYCVPFLSWRRQVVIRTTTWMYRWFLACRSNLSVGRLTCPGPYSRWSKHSYVESQ